MIDLFITSGKRPELFCVTIDSFRANCKDQNLISRWICIDDGTDEEWREKLAKKYPYFVWINKTKDQVGHAKSLNMLSPFYKTEFIIRLEDDWEFVKPGHFVRDAITILSNNPKIGQVMINKNYQESIGDDLAGGIESEQGFFFHQYISDPIAQKEWFEKTHPRRSVLVSWPNFSLQPSVTRTAALLECGPFNQESSYFEYQFAQNYTHRGWTTAFLPDCFCEHIGRHLNDFSGPRNAYELLGQEHFGRAPREYDPQKNTYWHHSPVSEAGRHANQQYAEEDVGREF